MPCLLLQEHSETISNVVFHSFGGILLERGFTLLEAGIDIKGFLGTMINLCELR